MVRVTPFPWYGSKYTQVSWLLDMLPQTERYVEPFGGSGVVIVNKEPAEIETFNDINSSIINFFDVIRERPDEFEQKLIRTPHSREMYKRSVEEDPDEEMTKALYFLVRVGQSFGGAEGKGWGRSIGTSRRGMAQRAAAWESRKEQVMEVAERMRRVQIENTDALDLIKDHDHPDCTFYCDPPYPEESRDTTGHYKYEFSNKEHRRLHKTLESCEGNVALSGYSCDLLDDLYEGWNIYKEGEKKLAGKNTGTREELLWTNYDVEEVVE